MRLARTGPRAVRLRDDFLTYLILGEVVLALILLGTPYLIDGIGGTEHELAKRGAVVTGKIHPRHSSLAPGTWSDNLKLRFTYRVAGMSLEGSSPVSLDTYYTARPGAPLKIRYFPEQPRTAMIDGSEQMFNRERSMAWTFYFGVLALFGGAALLWRAKAVRERRMLRDWTAYPAEVTKLYAISMGESKRYEVEVLVTDGDETQMLRMELQRGEPLREGSRTFLLQDPERPQAIRLAEDLKFVESVRSSSPYP